VRQLSIQLKFLSVVFDSPEQVVGLFLVIGEFVTLSSNLGLEFPDGGLQLLVSHAFNFSENLVVLARITSGLWSPWTSWGRRLFRLCFLYVGH